MCAGAAGRGGEKGAGGAQQIQVCMDEWGTAYFHLSSTGIAVHNGIDSGLAKRVI